MSLEVLDSDWKTQAGLKSPRQLLEDSGRP